MTSCICALVAVMVVAALSRCDGEFVDDSNRPGPNAIIPVAHDEPVVIYDEKQADLRMSKDIQHLMLQLLSKAAYLQHQLQEQQDGEEEQQEGPRAEALRQPMAYAPFMERPRNVVYEEPKQEDITSVLLSDLQDKRGSSYMSLCHFKICNMGRKRNLMRSPMWSRRK